MSVESSSDLSHSDYCVVTTTCSTLDEAKAISAALIELRLVACIQVLDTTSCYVWKGQYEIEPEKLLIIKTKRSLYADLESALLAVHPYETPEIIALPVIAGSPGYLAWIDEVVAAE